MKLKAIGFVGLAVGAGIHNAAHAETWLPIPQEDVGLQGANLGSTIAVGTKLDAQGQAVPLRLFVGAPGEAAGSKAGAGAVLVYTLTGNSWTYLETLFATLPQAGAHFGSSLAISSGHLLVGAPDFNDVGGIGANAGYVEFFFDNGSTPAAIISQRVVTGNGGNFGGAVAVNINMAAASAINASGGEGCVFTFSYSPATSWTPFPAASNVKCGSANAELGASLAIRYVSDTLFIMVAGAPAESQGGNALAGAAHVYAPSSGSSGGDVEIGTLAAQSPAFLDVFGASVGIDANFVYVGASGRDNGVGRVGSVTIFKPAPVIGYDLVDEYFPSPPATIGGHCGASLSVDIDNSQFILGCPDSAGTLAHEGTARVYRQYEFIGQPVWVDSVLSFGNQLHGADALGRSVAIRGDHAYAGAPNTNFPAPQTGNGAWKEFIPDEIFGDGFQ